MGFASDVHKLTVACVAVEMIRGLLPFGEATKARAVDKKDILQTVIIVVDERDSRAVRLDDVLLLALVPVSELHVQPCLARHVGKADGEGLARWRGPRRGRYVASRGTLGHCQRHQDSSDGNGQVTADQFTILRTRTAARTGSTRRPSPWA